MPGLLSDRHYEIINVGILKPVIFLYFVMHLLMISTALLISKKLNGFTSLEINSPQAPKNPIISTQLSSYHDFQSYGHSQN